MLVFANRLIDEQGIHQIVLTDKNNNEVCKTQYLIPNENDRLELEWEQIIFISIPTLEVMVTWNSLVNKFK